MTDEPRTPVRLTESPPTATTGPFLRIEDRTVLDLSMGLGSLLFGHCRPEIIDAVSHQARLGWRLGTDEGVVGEWLSRIKSLIRCAELVRPTSSATEANLLALRLARRVTGRGWVMRFDGHYHGCFDEALADGVAAVNAQGLHPMAGSRILVLDEEDTGAIEDYLATGRVAAVLLEPGGGGGGVLPYDPTRLEWLRAATRRTDTALIFDESMTAFRYGAGGVQAEVGVTPDMCVLSKILTGGMPGSVLAGSSRFLELVADRQDPRGVAPSADRVGHTSTFAGHPVTAAAGAASLRLASAGTHQRRAEDNATQIRGLLNDAALEVGSDWRVFRTRSILHFVLGRTGDQMTPKASRWSADRIQAQTRRHRSLADAWLAHGVLAHPVHCWISSAHDGAALEYLATTAPKAFDSARETDLAARQ